MLELSVGILLGANDLTSEDNNDAVTATVSSTLSMRTVVVKMSPLLLKIPAVSSLCEYVSSFMSDDDGDGDNLNNVIFIVLLLNVYAGDVGSDECVESFSYLTI